MEQGCLMREHLEIFNSRRALTIRRWTVTLSVSQCDALALGDKMEVMITHIHAIDFQAFTVLPSMSDLKIAKPRLTIESTLFFLFVQRIDILPARIPVVLRLDALM